MRPTRRRFLAGSAGLALAALARPLPASAQANAPRHGLSVFGDLKYPADFKHFDYVNPAAPKGGSLVLSAPNWYFNQNPNTFNTLNGYVFKGDAPPRIELCFDTLMTGALDEPSSIYGLIAEQVAISDDGNSYVFTLREAARFNDGTPLTADDVVFSLTVLKEKGHPDISQTIREMVSVTATGPHEVTVVFSGKQNTKVPLYVAGSLPIFSKAFYATRDFEASTMEPPLGSGPYRIGKVNPGRSIDYERVADYWAKDLPVAIGTGNFQRVRVEFYQDEDVEFQAFAKGEITWREEFSSKNWATRYDFPAVLDGRVIKPAFPAEHRADMYGWFFNLRRAKFADPRTRQAIGMAFDFPWANKNLFFGLYQRASSFFEMSDFAASGLPDAAELALLEPFRDKLPPEIFDQPPFTPPEADGSGRDRKLLRQASDLLQQAGWKPQGSGLVNAAGEKLEVEFLIQTQAFERVLAPLIANLKAIGVGASLRLVDAAQYQSRKNAFDYDVIAYRVMLDATPIDGIEQLFGSVAADIPSGSNLAGLKNPVVDALVAQAGAVKSRAELITLMRALDRVLRASQIWFPAWYSDAHRVAVWDMFGWPDTKPDYGFSPEVLWWVDIEKAVKIGKAD
ncbi:extracellular solute-binding protein [Kaistia dalseonensis]|uniref:Microcin C transport system substrate-binding protein n=1 Tax=Kaistia dalseonensis TaxID=410840 RepID=A0ABU0H9G8_9HYPH|nr:extracellular solute-binding protein [Kaistia dalseonensis]MCX5496328.1 extracellular solute-binding protein [Kaistia dalseonensis]MDQ0438947.1 microcin C transport system substrate-binding protein [Kaistia dalseonensis]